MLEFKVSGQTLTRIDSFRPAEKSRGYLTAKFSFLSDEWKSGTLEARVKNRQDVVVYEAEIVNDQCLIPWEALSKNGVMQISVFMKNGDVEITTNFVDVGISSTLPSGTESNPPTPSELDLIRQQISDLSERVDSLDPDGGDIDLTGYATEEWVKDQKYLTEVPDGYAKTEDIPTDEHIIELIEENAPESSGGIAVTGAKVGQIIKIAEVDENGVPTAWEPADFPSGGDEPREWEEFMRFATDNAETTVFDFSSNGTETLESKKVKEFYLYSPNCNSGDCVGAVTINESITIENLLYFCRPTGTLKLSLAVSPEALKFRYFGRDTDLHFNTPAASFVTMMGQSIGNNVKAFAFNITEMRDGIAFPSSSVDYIKTVTVTLLSPCLSGVEFIVYVR